MSPPAFGEGHFGRTVETLEDVFSTADIQKSSRVSRKGGGCLQPSRNQESRPIQMCPP
jgi:hypothetical protein